MDVAGHDLLAGAGFPGERDRRVGRGNLGGGFQHRLPLGRRTDAAPVPDAPRKLIGQ
jgi:hypothetical protein